jgi:uncharacterized protein
MRFNKEIVKLKIAVTSACCLRCTHCFIDKSRPETIPLGDALRTVYAFLGSPGGTKTLELYGGEPLLEFELVKHIITAAKARARKLGKRLAVSVASNGVPAGPEQLNWLAARGVRFAVSFSGSGKSHDMSRKFASGKGSHAAVAGKLPLFISTLGENLHAILCVHPRRAAAVHGDFLRLVGQGFTHIGIECVHGFPWRRGDLAAFEAGMRKITRFTLGRAAAGRPVVLEPLLEFFREREYAGSFCPFLRDLELFPDGTLSFYPYPFLRTPAQRKAAAVGSARRGAVKRFRDCKPEAGSRRCAGCARSYYKLPGMAGGSRAHALRTAVCMEAAGELIARSSSEPAMKAYMKRLIGLFKKGYI